MSPKQTCPRCDMRIGGWRYPAWLHPSWCTELGAENKRLRAEVASLQETLKKIIRADETT